MLTSPRTHAPWHPQQQHHSEAHLPSSASSGAERVGGQTLSGLVNAKSHPLPCAVSMMSHSDVAMPLAASLFSKLLCWLPLVKVKSMHRVRGRSVPTLHPQKC